MILVTGNEDLFYWIVLLNSGTMRSLSLTDWS